MNEERWKDIEALLLEALERPAEERTAFLAERCGDDEELREEVAALLEASDQAGAYFSGLAEKAGLASPDVRDGATDGAPTPNRSGDTVRRGPGGPDDGPRQPRPGNPGNERPRRDGSGPLVGRTIAHFKVTGVLGRGGMGEVYRATDARLGREVALKVLPEELADDERQAARFEREARLLAALSHPNIGAIYGLEEAGERKVLVLELVEGRTLRERLTAEGRGLPLDEVLPLARQMARALEVAHERGIVHRDLKPANIKITPDGTIKVLDFGIAKAMAGADAATGPTAIDAHTRPGIVVGTTSYMSPEQARGRPVDRRSDIWAFGALLFEMLAGRKAFEGEDTTQTLARILERDPDWGVLPAGLPARLRHLLARCLTKDPERRLQAIGEARILLDEVMEGAEAGPEEELTAAPGGWRSPARRGSVPWWLAAAAAATTALLALWLGAPDAPLPQSSLRKLRLAIPPLAVAPIISPDGSRIVYTGRRGLWLLPLARTDARFIEGSDDGTNPFWSPDGAYIGFRRGGQIWKVAADGGRPAPVCTIPGGAFLGGTWSEDGTIVFAASAGLFAVRDVGGEPRLVLPRGEDANLLAPHALPGGALALAVGFSGRIDVVSAGQRKTVVDIEGWRLHSPVYAPSGHLLFRRLSPGPGIWAVPFSLERLEATGDPFLVTTDGASLSVSRDGTLVYDHFPPTMRQIVRVSRGGQIEERIGQPRLSLSSPALSPDGSRLAYTALEGAQRSVWVLDLRSGTDRPLTPGGPATEGGATWSPDGTRLVYVAEERGARTLRMQSADGSGEERVLVEGFSASFTAGGRELLFFREDPVTSSDIWVVDLESGEERPVLRTEQMEVGPVASPDGRLFAYVGGTPGHSGVMVRPYPPGDGLWQVSGDIGRAPVWSRDGSELFFFEGEELRRVTVELDGSSGRFDRPQVVLSADQIAALDLLSASYDVPADGDGLLMIQNIRDELDPPGFILVQNWAAEFGRER